RERLSELFYLAGAEYGTGPQLRCADDRSASALRDELPEADAQTRTEGDAPAQGNAGAVCREGDPAHGKNRLANRRMPELVSRSKDRRERDAVARFRSGLHATNAGGFREGLRVRSKQKKGSGLHRSLLLMNSPLTIDTDLPEPVPNCERTRSAHSHPP